MSAVNDLIERLEIETGKRIDEDNGDNAAMAGLFGAISCLMGQSPPSYRECDDVTAGLLIRHQMTPEYEQEQATKRSVTELLVGGMSPDDVKDLLG